MYNFHLKFLGTIRSHLSPLPSHLQMQHLQKAFFDILPPPTTITILARSALISPVGRRRLRRQDKFFFFIFVPPSDSMFPCAAPLCIMHFSRLSTVKCLQSVTTQFLRKLSHTPRIIKQHNSHLLISKTIFTHYDYKPSNSKKFFFKSVPLFPFSQPLHLQFKTKF